MRLEGGRYRFTTEPNLNKVVLEREGAISEDRIETLLREAIGDRRPQHPRAAGRTPRRGFRRPARQPAARARHPRLQPPRRRRCVRSDDDGQPGRSWSIAAVAGAPTRTPPCSIAADAPAIAKARATARTLAALRDLNDDRHRLDRFNAEQREQLGKAAYGS